MGLFDAIKGGVGDFVTGTIAGKGNPMAGLANAGVGLVDSLLGGGVIAPNNPAAQSMNRASSQAMDLASALSQQQQQQFGIEQPFRQSQLSALQNRNSQPTPTFAPQQMQLFNPYLNVNRVRPNFGPAGLSLGRSGMAGPSPFQTLQAGPTGTLNAQTAGQLMGLPQQPQAPQGPPQAPQRQPTPDDMLRIFSDPMFRSQNAPSLSFAGPNGQQTAVAANDLELQSTQGVGGSRVNPHTTASVYNTNFGSQMPTAESNPSAWLEMANSANSGSLEDQSGNRLIAQSTNMMQDGYSASANAPQNYMEEILRRNSGVMRNNGMPMQPYYDPNAMRVADPALVAQGVSSDTAPAQQLLTASQQHGSTTRLVPQGGDTFAVVQTNPDGSETVIEIINAHQGDGAGTQPVPQPVPRPVATQTQTQGSAGQVIDTGEIRANTTVKRTV